MEIKGISISNSQIGNLNLGEQKSIESISVNISNLEQTGNKEVAEAIRKLTEAVGSSDTLDEESRRTVIDQLEELSRQALLPENERAKTGVIKALLTGVAGTLAAAGSLAQVWSTWGTPIRVFFGF